MNNKSPINTSEYIFLPEIYLESKIQLAVKTAILDLQKTSLKNSKEILRVSEAAALLGLHPSTIYRHIRNNQIPFVKRNGSVWLLRSQLLSWLKYNDKPVVDVVLEVLKTNKTCVLVFPEKHE
ncbi:helix-turn-helix domain-containing protein [Dyadobacter frigoris]|uniref:Helix-turn-helix domain-containing protein n=1 Tax=Dyadobacter frigoris TaxID=2576211 RepID=A0A4U6DBL7_9BACT|nr:helix-turn-helix domain-containing protein [Dyadobacter frigoris]TKT94165.1 helix-turn-helix domain-containing protein [Dyadobacter frigoris]